MICTFTNRLPGSKFPDIWFLMTESPLLILVLFAGAAYLAKLWYDDYRATNSGNPNPRALPGATSASLKLIWIGVFGAIILVGIETVGEISLGVSEDQTDIPAILLLSMIGAGILEEIIFRGYLAIQSKGRNLLILSVIGFSLLFALLHYQYYIDYSNEGDYATLTIKLGLKESWSLMILFVNSLWFYSLRFLKWNPNRSLMPCFSAHIASNIAVFVVKLAQGHVVGLW